MNHLDTFIIDLALIMAAAGAVTLIFKRFKLPVVLGYILAGFLISPNFVWLPTVVELDNIETWGNIGIVFLMFGLGLEFSFMKLRTVGHAAIVTALTVICGMIPLGYLVGKMLGWSNMNSVFLGCMISMSSTMVILKAYEEYHMKKQKFASIVLGALVIEDILGIFMMIVLSTISVSRSTGGSQLMLHLGTLLVYLLAWVFLGVLLIPTLLRKTKRFLNDETLLIISVAICLSMVVIANLIGFSEALGAFLGGSILAGTISAERIDRLITPIKDMFGAVFFVSVGMMIVPGMLVKYIVPILIISAVTIVGQMTLSIIGILFSGQTLNTAVRGGMSMVQVGEFSFILAALGKTLDVTGVFLFPIVVCVSIITIITTPIFMKNSGRMYTFLDRVIPDRLRVILRRYTRDTGGSQESSDWKVFMKRYALRSGITMTLLFIIYQAATRQMLPFMIRTFDGFTGYGLTALAAMVLMMPVISLMWYDRSSLYKKLWLTSRYNHFPLVALRMARLVFAVFMIVITLEELLDISVWILIPLSLILMIIIFRSEYMRSRSIKMEMSFVANMNERILHKRKKERKDEKKWLGDSLYVVEFGMDQPGICTSIRMLHDTRMVDARIIKIIREGKHINMPGPDEEMCTGDVITAMGRRDKLENYLMILESAEHIRQPEEKPMTLREYVYREIFAKVPPEDQIMLCVIPVGKDTPFAGKSIRNSEFKDSYGGFIIALERDNLSIPDPDIGAVIEEGDIVWAIGTKRMADKLLSDGLMEEDKIAFPSRK